MATAITVSGGRAGARPLSAVARRPAGRGSVPVPGVGAGDTGVEDTGSEDTGVEDTGPLLAEGRTKRVVREARKS
ncbi:hypothetical protein GCM10027160_06320 [Streptomyces calidiresistens]